VCYHRSKVDRDLASRVQQDTDGHVVGDPGGTDDRVDRLDDGERVVARHCENNYKI